MRDVLFLLSSARSGGNTELLARRAARNFPAAQWVDLAARDLPAFRDPRPLPPPPGSGLPDDLVAALLRAGDVVFVAPVYWYALPAPAKLFLDHWSGLLDRPDLDFATRMAGKRIWLITCRADPDPGVARQPEAMLRRSARWMRMHWGGALHGLGDAPGEVRAHAAWDKAVEFLTLPGPALACNDSE